MDYNDLLTPPHTIRCGVYIVRRFISRLMFKAGKWLTPNRAVHWIICHYCWPSVMQCISESVCVYIYITFFCVSCFSTLQECNRILVMLQWSNGYPSCRCMGTKTTCTACALHWVVALANITLGSTLYHKIFYGFQRYTYVIWGQTKRTKWCISESFSLWSLQGCLVHVMLGDQTSIWHCPSPVYSCLYFHYEV